MAGMFWFAFFGDSCGDWVGVYWAGVAGLEEDHATVFLLANENR
jgi:hypothetical protein